MFSLTVICTAIWTSITYFLLCLYQQLYSPIVVKNAIVPTTPRANGLPRPIDLPVETLDLIFLFHIASLVNDLQCETARDYRIQQKRFMKEVCRVARCSRLFNEVMHNSLRRIWASSPRCPCPSVAGPGPGDPPALSVQIITAETGSFPRDFCLAAYKVLEIASINYHGGVEWNGSEKRFSRFRCIIAYPPSLRQLEIFRLHAPEEEVIQLVSDCCPALTELRLVRCTMFNDPNCWYWRAHTTNQDHDYMQSYEPGNMIPYANRIALRLRGLQQLEVIHIGHYLISIDAVFTHRMDQAHKSYHPITDNKNYVDGAKVFSNVHLLATAIMDEGPPMDAGAVRLADRELWAQPCPQCEREFGQPLEEAERLASAILAAHFNSLKKVSFAGFLSKGRVLPSCWQ
ncbi:hypothetical protein FRC11_008415, partial [Ceratobasidium sp. 423]